ncbi:hypothetical protein [Salinicoccus sp. CNSTN-B1]
MWQKLLDIQKRIAPEVVSELQKRSTILKQIRTYQPIGRRPLARQLNMTERVLRKEVDALHDLDLIDIDKKGISISQTGIEVLDELSPFMTTLDRRSGLALKLQRQYNLQGCHIIRGMLMKIPSSSRSFPSSWPKNFRK